MRYEPGSWVIRTERFNHPWTEVFPEEASVETARPHQVHRHLAATLLVFENRPEVWDGANFRQATSGEVVAFLNQGEEELELEFADEGDEEEAAFAFEEPAQPQRTFAFDMEAQGFRNTELGNWAINAGTGVNGADLELRILAQQLTETSGSGATPPQPEPVMEQIGYALMVWNNIPGGEPSPMPSVNLSYRLGVPAENNQYQNMKRTFRQEHYICRFSDVFRDELGNLVYIHRDALPENL